jgi:hypothetical protein
MTSIQEGVCAISFPPFALEPLTRSLPAATGRRGFQMQTAPGGFACGAKGQALTEQREKAV